MVIFRFLHTHHPLNTAVCPATIGIPKPMQGCILIATLKIGAAQVGTRNRIPGGARTWKNWGCKKCPKSHLYVVFWLVIPQPKTEKSFVTVLGVAILYPLFQPPGLTRSSCRPALKLHPSFKPTRKTLNRSRSSKIHLNSVRKIRRMFFFPVLASSGLTSSRLWLYIYCVGTRGCCTSFLAIPTGAYPGNVLNCCGQSPTKWSKLPPNIIQVHPLPTSRLVEGKAATTDREPYWNHSFSHLVSGPKCPLNIFNLWVFQTSSAGVGPCWSWAPGCKRYETLGSLLQSALHAKIWLPAGYFE